MLYLRSLLFNLAWYINLIVQMVVQTPFYFFMSHKNALQVPKRWARSSYWLHKVICGTDIIVEGQENIPSEGCIIASKHQSLWDFYAINEMVPDGAFIFKHELMKIPFFGWYVTKLDHIPIRRGDRSKALRRMLVDAKVEIEKERQIIIFPEGTRRAAGAEPSYRFGVTRMYLELNCPVVPVALNSGLFWPRRKFIRHPGTIRTRFLEPIMPGLTAEEFSRELVRRIEEGCDELNLLAKLDGNLPPLSAEARDSIERAEERQA